MKKFFALIFLAAFALPTFAYTLIVGDETRFAPRKTSPNGIVTKVAPIGDGEYEFAIVSDNITYTYIVSQGSEFTAYGKQNSKSKVNSPKIFRVRFIENNTIELEEAPRKTQSVQDAK